VQEERSSVAVRRIKGGGRRPILEMGSCLKVTGALLDGVPITVVLDSGAGVSIVGERFVGKWEGSYGKVNMEKVDLKIAGVYSGASLSVAGMMTFPLVFQGAKAPTLVTAVVVPEWKGELLLGWRTLKNLGIELVFDRPVGPVTVKMRKIGAEMEAMETPQDGEILMAEAVGYSVDEGMKRLEREYEAKKGRELRRRNREKLVKGRKERGISRWDYRREIREGYKRRRVEGQRGIHRGKVANRWSKEEWREQCWRRRKGLRRDAEDAVARMDGSGGGGRPVESKRMGGTNTPCGPKSWQGGDGIYQSGEDGGGFISLHGCDGGAHVGSFG
jgi:hypothetical protein